METADVNGHFAMIIRKNNISQVVWVNETLGYQVIIGSESLPSDSLMKIAENLSIS